MSRTPSLDRERDLCARDLRDACEATSRTAADLARHWGCSETLAREILSGARPLTGEREATLPADTRDDHRRRRAARVAGERPHLLTPEGKAQVVSARAADLIGRSIRALADGRLTPAEARELLGELRPMLADGGELAQQLEGVARQPELRAVEGGR